MFGIEFIEVGIGLVFAFFAVSTICSGVVEVWTRLTKLRSRHLRDALKTMLDDPEMDNLVKKLYNHPGLFAPVKKKIGAADYIDAKDFAETFLDVLAGAGDAALQRALLDKAKKIKDEALQTSVEQLLSASPAKVKELETTLTEMFENETSNFAFATYIASFKAGSLGYEGLKARISSIESAAIREKLSQLLNFSPTDLTNKKSEIQGWFENPPFCEACFELLAFTNPSYDRFKRLEKEILAIQDKYLRQKMLRILYECSDRMEKLESRIENWFNDTMEDVSRWYKKRIQWVLLGISIVVVVGLNADAVRLASELWNDNQLRAATVQLADDYVERQDSIWKMKQTMQQSQQMARLAVTLDSNATVSADAEDAVQSDSVGIADFQKIYTELKNDIEVTEQMPIGWNSEPLPWNKNFPRDRSLFWWYLSKVLGLAITVGATSFGATFWYDLLRNLLSLRTGLVGGSRENKQNNGNRESTE